MLAVTVLREIGTKAGAASATGSASLDAFKRHADTMTAFVVICDAAGRNTFTNDFFRSFTGRTAEQLMGDGWFAVLHPDDVARAQTVWREAVTRRTVYAAEYRFRRHDGIYHWFLCCGSPHFDQLGEVDRWIILCFDVHEEKRAQEAMKTLVGELHHRTRNLLNVVLALARRLAGRANSVPHFLVQFEDRLRALSRVQGLLAQSKPSPITVSRLLELELGALGPMRPESQTQLSGPVVTVPDALVQDLLLAIHELATNALKHGAFATASGRLAVQWSVEEAGGRRMLVIVWNETGLRRREAASAGNGFGRDLIERAVPFNTGGHTTLDIGEDAISCRIVLPLDAKHRIRAR
jgi:two-component system CheB/CheR fusion protein